MDREGLFHCEKSDSIYSDIPTIDKLLHKRNKMQQTLLLKALTLLVNIGNIYSKKYRKGYKAAYPHRGCRESIMSKIEIDIKRLKETVVLKNMTLEGLAGELGMSRTTLYRKLRRGHAGLTLKEAADIAASLQLTGSQVNVIFGGGYVPRV